MNTTPYSKAPDAVKPTSTAPTSTAPTPTAPPLLYPTTSTPTATATAPAPAGMKTSIFGKTKNIMTQSQKDLEFGRTERLKRMRRRTCLHKCFIFLNVLVALAACLMIVAQVWAMSVKDLIPLEVVVRLYTIGLCILAILIEADWFSFTRNSPIVQNWIPRGIFYTFIAFLAMVEQDIGNDNYYNRKNSGGFFFSMTKEHVAEFLIGISSWIMLGYGILYIFLGVLCVQIAFNKVRDEYERRVAEWKQESLEAKRKSTLLKTSIV